MKGDRRRDPGRNPMRVGPSPESGHVRSGGPKSEGCRHRLGSVANEGRAGQNR